MVDRNTQNEEDLLVHDFLSDDKSWIQRHNGTEKDPNPMNYLKYIYKTYNPEKYKKMKEGFKAAGNSIEDEDNDEIYEEWKKNYEASNRQMDEALGTSSTANNMKTQNQNRDDAFEISLPANDESTLLEDVDVGDLPMCKTDNFFEEVESQSPGQASASYLPTLVEKAENISIGDTESHGDDNNENAEGVGLDEESKQENKTSNKASNDDDSDDDEEEEDVNVDEEVNYAVHGPPSSIEFVLPLESMGTYRVPPIRTDADRFLEIYIEQRKKKDEQKVNENDKPSVFYNDNFKTRTHEIVVDPESDEEEVGDRDVDVVEEIGELPSGNGSRIGAILEAMKNRSLSTSTDHNMSHNEGRSERSFTTVEVIHEDGEALLTDL